MTDATVAAMATVGVATMPPDIDHSPPHVSGPTTSTRTITETTTEAQGISGGLLGKFAQFGNMTAIGFILVMFAFGGYFLITSFSSGLKDKIADDKEARLYQQTIHDRDMLLLTNGITKNTENTASMITELKAGREAIDKEAKARQEAFERRTEQQHQQIKELHDLMLKSLMQKQNP